MNLRTTLVLLILAVSGAGVWYTVYRTGEDRSRAEERAADSTTVVLEETFKEGNIKSVRIEQRGREVLAFERSKSGDWVLPGRWPAEQEELKALVKRLCSLRSRFAPLPIDDDNPLKKYNLDSPEYVVTIEAGPTRYKLALAEGNEADNRFFRPLYARLDERKEVIRLGPGLLSALGRSRDVYQDRQFFPSVNEPRNEGSTGSTDRVDRLSAHSATVEQTGKDGFSYTLTRDGRGWHLSKPGVYRTDPAKADQIREVVGSLWAERFVESSLTDTLSLFGLLFPSEGGLDSLLPLYQATQFLPRKDEAASDAWRRCLRERYGLDKPERIIRVQRSAEEVEPITLRIGDIFSSTPGRRRPPMAPGMPPTVEPGQEFRLAEIEGNNQLFLIQSDRLKEIFIEPTALRDQKLARFEKSEVQSIEVTQGTEKLVLTREEGPEEKWTFQMPGEATPLTAQKEKVNELLDQLGGLSGQQLDRELPILGATALGMMSPSAGAPLLAATSVYPGRAKGLAGQGAFGKPIAVVKLTTRENISKGVNRKTKHVTLTIGEHDAQNKQLLVRVDDWKRVEVIDDAPLALFKRPALAYRGKLFDFAIDKVEKLVIEENGKTVALTQSGDKWKLSNPADTDADPGKVGHVLTQLTRLEPTEYVAENPSPTDLDKLYGLSKSPVAVQVQVGGKLKRLRLGKQREGKLDYFAQLDGSPSVFTVTADVQSSLKADPIAYLPTQLWRVEPDQLKTIRVDKAGAEPYTLQRQESGVWKLSEPVTAAAQDATARPMIDVLSNPFCERYESLSIKNPKDYGFDKPYLKVSLLPTKPTDLRRELVVGDKVKGSLDRYARRGDNATVFVLRGDVVNTFDHDVLDLVDTQLLNVNLDNVKSVKAQVGEAKLRLQLDGKAWKVFDATPSPFVADENAMTALGSKLLNLRAERFTSYGGKLDLPGHGLDKPFATVTVSISDAGKMRDVTLLIGAEVKDKKGQRYARLDNGPGIAILSAGDTRVLTRTYLDYVDHKMLALAPEKVTAVQRQKGNETLEIVKQDDEWQIRKPAEQRADDKILESLLRQMIDLRAAGIAEFPLKDAKKFGLDTPSAVVTFKLGGGQHVVTLGGETPEKNGQRYAKVDATPTVFILPAAVVKSLEAAPLLFRTRALARFSDADKILFGRGPRQATLTRVGGSWTMTEPTEAKVDNDQIEEFLNKAARLEADELVAEKPTDLKQYGLDKPVARWRFQADSKDVLDLLIGKREGRRSYATVGKDGLVFLLSPEMTIRALGEYRERTVWTMPIDGAQVDTLKLTRDGKTTTLKKDGTIWSSVEKPTAKINSETVNDTVAALAGLKLERYAVDAKAERKLFGLEPPVLVVEAEAGDRKTVLHIGRFEGDSKQAYACVPGRGTDVFVLSEADTTRLMRDLEGFGKDLPRPKKDPPFPR